MGRVRYAFTLVELLVVVAIIGALVSVLLPALQAGREAARRAMCMSNQKQVALGVLSYESTRGTLPPSGIVGHNAEATYSFGSYNPKSGRMISWAVLILPFLEEKTLYDQYDLKRSILDQPNNPQASRVATYSCPSDSSPDHFYQHDEHSEGIRFSKGNYAAFVSPFHIDEQIWFPGALGGGRWTKSGERIGQRLRRIKDGLSKTVMLSEVRTSSDPRDQRGAWALPWAGSSLLALDVHPPVMLTRGSKRIIVSFRSGVHPQQLLPYEPFVDDGNFAQSQRPNGVRPDMLYDCSEPERKQLNNIPCATWGVGEGHDSRYLSAAARSRHTGGVLMASVDGHVEFVVNEIDPEILSYMVSINDGRTDRIRND